MTLAACERPTSAPPPVRPGDDLIAALAAVVDHAPEADGLSIPRDVRLSVTASKREPGGGLSVVVRRATDRLGRGLDANALHALGLADLLASAADTAPAPLDRAIANLVAAARVADRPARVLADLSAAYLLRAERRRDARALCEAVEAGALALDRAPTDAAARYNFARALDRLGLPDRAAAAWRGYLEIDSTSAWATDARERRRALLHADTARPAPPVEGASAAVAAAFAADHPQAAREYGWDEVLPAWGRAESRGDAFPAARRLALAAGMGGELSRRGGDATLGDAVRAIRGARGDRRRRLALAHAAYGDAQRAYRVPRYSHAESLFARSAHTRGASAALDGWAATFAAMARVHAGDRVGGLARLQRVVAASDTARHPALAGRALWMLGTTLFRSGRPEAALEAFTRMQRFATRAGEAELLANASGLQMQARGALGERAAMYDAMAAAFDGFRAYRASYWTHGVLLVAAGLLADDGLVRTAELVQAEGVTVAARTRRPVDLAEARLAYARLLTLRGADEVARAVIDSALPDVRAVDDPRMRRWLTADLNLSRALVADSRRAER